MDLWVTPEECCSTSGPGDATADQRLAACLVASEVMWAKTARMYGLGVDTVRPCRGPVGDGYRFDLPSSSLFGFPISRPYYHGRCGCSSVGQCGCRQKDSVRLPRDRVREILEVKVDGEVLADSAYRLRRPNVLYRMDGETWPCCQDVALEDDEEGTWSVRYRWGRPVPHVARMGARRLACEVLKGLVDDPTCRLPSNARSVSARGITVDLVQLLEQLGATGLFEVDLAVQTLNPDGLQMRASAWSPEVSGRAVRVDPVETS